MKRDTSISPLYSPHLSRSEKRFLRRIPIDDLSSEINLLRVLAARFMKFQSAAPPDLYSRILTLRTCSLLNEQLALLVFRHFRIHGSVSELDQAIEAAIDALEDDWKDA
jgi:hypothetical protein